MVATGKNHDGPRDAVVCCCVSRRLKKAIDRRTRQPGGGSRSSVLFDLLCPQKVKQLIAETEQLPTFTPYQPVRLAAKSASQ